MSEFREGLQKGFRHFGLLGTEVGAYGHDLGYSLTDLLGEMTAQEERVKIGLRNINPYHLKNMLNELVPLLESKRIWYMECPAESGSNRILKLMNRNYSVEEYKDWIKTVRKAYPNIIIRTQLMVGFPTETEEDFKETLHLLDDVVLDFAEVYKYSKRPKTVAARMEPQVPDQIKKQRFFRAYRKAVLNRTPRKINHLLRGS
jgi:tRNA-2-methylthio-N6-dimethylallyladenosine synthase